MTGQSTISGTRQIEHTVAIVSAYVANNHVHSGNLTALIESVHSALGNIGLPEARPEQDPDKATPAQIRKSITRDGLTSFIDGKIYKTLKRHIAGHGLDPQSYRERYGLPHDYPMVSVSYSETRSALARQNGLGRKPEPSDASDAEADSAPVPRKIGTGKRTKAA